MTAPTPADFEDQVAAALRRRATVVTADTDARASIDRRIAQRARTRRVRRVGITAVVVVALLAGAVAFAERGHDDASVVTGPGVPAVHIPQLGLPTELGATGVIFYSPGRRAEVGLYPKLTGGAAGLLTRNPAFSAQFVLYVSDLTPTDYVHDVLAVGTDGMVESCDVGGAPAECVSPTQAGSSSRGLVVWQAAPRVLGRLSVTASTEPESSGSRAALVAGELVEMDDDSWWTMSGEAPSVAGLTWTSPDGHAELAVYGPSDSGGYSVQVFEVAGWAPGTFQLIGSAGAQPATSLPDQFAGTKLEDVTVRGVPGVVTTVPQEVDLGPPFAYTRSLLWVEGGLSYRLDFTDAASPADAVAFAARLGPLTEARWHDLLYPETIRTDLVPIRSLSAVSSPPTTDG